MLPDSVCIQDIRRLAKRNTWFRYVLQTGTTCQVVLMAVPPGEEVGDEISDTTDHLLVLVEGEATVILDGKGCRAARQDMVFVRAGTRYNVKNAGKGELKLYCVHAPPAYAEGTIHRTREDAVGAMIARRPAYLL
jgi:mannose-6-phosphate isomerase-like protein (cupin superfamily)